MKIKFRCISFVLIFIFLSSCSQKITSEAAPKVFKKRALASSSDYVVITPVIDGLGTGPRDAFDQKRYQNLPYSGPQRLSNHPWERSHQLLFNQRVKLLKEKEKEAYVSVPNLLFKGSKNAKFSPLKVWVQKKHIVPLATLEERGIDTQAFPEVDLKKNKELVATLISPHKFHNRKELFSAGTRFKVASVRWGKVQVYVFNPQSLRVEVNELSPGTFVLNDGSNSKQQISKFLSILDYWAHPGNGFIPYVLGGSSFTNTISSNQFLTLPIKDARGNIVKDGSRPAYKYERKPLKMGLKSGFDCSTLIYNAALASGIPYYCKNTTAIANTLKKLEKKDTLEAGDIIWIPGHVMVVTEASKGLSIIQARGYSSKQGKVYKASAEELFTQVKNPKDLIKLYHQKKPLVLKNSKGKAGSVYKNWQIFKLSSCYDVNYLS
jgi:cell wall-associated NlpC family hydrolase